MNSRIRKAQELGLKITSTTQNGLTTSAIEIPNLTTFKQVLDAGTSHASREELARLMFEGTPRVGSAKSDGTVTGTLRRVSEYLLGNATLAPEDEQRAAGQFPHTYTIVTGAPSGPIRGEWCLGIKQPAQEYDLDSLDMEDGGFITVYATPLTFSVKNLTRNGGPPPARYDFNIYGFTGDTGGPVPSLQPASQAATGNNGTCTVSGSEPGDDGGAGSTGATGITGNTGNSGGPGYASCGAKITIRGLTGDTKSLSVFTQSGTGGAGGTGGQGAAGQQGGQGGAGATCECTGTSGGRGGDGGRGGTGGAGGTGGPGTNATQNVLVYVPSTNLVGKTAAPDAPAGPGGAPGSGGAGGQPGQGGSGGKGHTSPGAGTQGQTGPTGATGSAGTSTGASSIQVRSL